MNKIEHLGIAVSNAVEANKVFAKLLNAPAYKSEEVASEGVNTHFFRLGPNKIELLESATEDNAVAKFLNKKGQGIHHVAISVTDIKGEMERLQKEGFVFLLAEPKKGADNKLINFIHPKSACGVLVELCQEAPADSK